MAYNGRRMSGRSRRNGDAVLVQTMARVLLFPALLLYLELVLHIYMKMSLAYVPVYLVFSLAGGLFLSALALPWRRLPNSLVAKILAVLLSVIYVVEMIARTILQTYYGLSSLKTAAGNKLTDYADVIISTVLSRLPIILVFLLPSILLCIFGTRLLGFERLDVRFAGLVVIACVVFHVVGLGVLHLPWKGDLTPSRLYKVSTDIDDQVEQLGLLTMLRLDVKHMFFPPENDMDADFSGIGTLTPGGSSSGSADPSGSASEPDPGPVIDTSPNVMDIDLAALAENGKNDDIKWLAQYFNSVTPTKKNEYTGMFEGYNVIFLTLEGFSGYGISQELTPTLYKLTHEGFVFNNFYQPDWTLSTTGGEFAVTTGLIPNWYNGGKLGAPLLSVQKSMPITLAKLFAAEGYAVPAWHNHTYTYYHRDEYLGNFGYDYKGIGNGLELPSDLWPNSDLEMMEATADSYIDGYVKNGTPFHAYYMTVSGHGYYSWGGNAMSRKHRAEVEAKYPDLSETCQAYLACNMELDLALECLVDKLEAAGIADDTLIVMTGDHYPYLMVTDEGDFYNELRGFEDTESDTSRYRNTLLMWSGCIEEPIVVDTPCFTPDIVPTMCNLFGLDYDSRLYSGRDIFAENYQANQYSNCMPLVVFANKGKGNAWITAAGVYESSTKTFTPNEGVELEDEEDYVKRVHRLVAAKINYSKLILQEDYYKYVFADSE